MHSKILFLLIYILFSFSAYNQVGDKKAGSTSDSTEVNRLLQLSKDNFGEAPEKAITLAEKARVLADSIKYYPGVALALKNIGIAYYYQGMDVEALEYWKKSFETYKSIGDVVGESNILNNIGAIYFNQGDDAKALEYYLQSLTLAEKTGDKLRILTALNNIGGVYNNKPATKDKALSYFLKALPLSEAQDDKEAFGTTAVNIGEIYYENNNDSLALLYFDKSEKAFNDSENSPYVYNAIGKVYYRKGLFNLAIAYHKKALAIAEKLNGNQDIVQSLLGLGNAYIGDGVRNKGLSYLSRAEKIATEYTFNKELKDIYEKLAAEYSINKDYKNAYIYQTRFSNIKDTLYNIETDQKLGSLHFDFEMLKKEGQINLLTRDKEFQQIAITRQRMAIIAFLIGVLIVLSIAVYLYKTLDKLKSTQANLIHSEKMASLGELTSGIAHEIQNPLNFVNNFSEVSQDLILEMNEELEKGDIEEAKIISDFLKSNLEKINQHGNRASDIVKGMLQHSRTGSGQKEKTNINVLTDEFTRLSHSSFLAKDLTFTGVFETHFDSNIPKIDVIPQEIGRVIHNIVNNAFYAVHEKSKKGVEGFEPKVTVHTSKVGDKIVIKIADNGTGMPDKVKEKIFQPFFTTKPTGQGTGLGLSLSYNIIKAHGGSFKVESSLGDGTEFIIALPIAS